MHISIPLPKSLARPLSPAWRFSLVIFLAGRIFYSLWGALVWTFFTIPDQAWQFYRDIVPVVHGPAGALLGMWQRWDAIHYQRILMFGYEDAALTAFFPLYPLLGRAVSFLTGASPLLALTLVSSLAFLFSLRVLYGIVEDSGIVKAASPADLARQTLLALLIFPTSFFFYALLPLSLLLLLVLLAYRFARQRRWAAAALAAFFAGLTHPLSLPLILLLGWEAWPGVVAARYVEFIPGPDPARLEKATFISRPIPPATRLAAALAPIAAPAGFGAFLLWRKLAGFPSIASLVTQTWDKGNHMPSQGLWLVIQHAFSLTFSPDYFMDWVEVLFFLLVSALVLVMLRKRLSFGLALYSAGVVGLFLCTNIAARPLQNFLRYQVMAFPIYITLALIGQHSKGWRLIKFTLSILLTFLCATLFFMWVSYLT